MMSGMMPYEKCISRYVYLQFFVSASTSPFDATTISGCQREGSGDCSNRLLSMASVETLVDP